MPLPAGTNEAERLALIPPTRRQSEGVRWREGSGCTDRLSHAFLAVLPRLRRRWWPRYAGVQCRRAPPSIRPFLGAPGVE